VNLTSFRGITFTTLGVTSPKWANVASPGSVRNIAALNRIGADPIITGVENGPRSMAFEFTAATGQHVESTLAKVIAACNPDDPVPGTLVGVFNKAAGTAVTVEAQATAVGPWQYPDVNTVRVTFVLSSPWREQSATNLLTATVYSADGSFANLNTGYRDVLPVITVGGLGGRSSKNATYGFEKRWQVTLTNSGTEPLTSYPYQIGPFNSAARVSAGDMLASGNDLRVFAEGVEWPRNLIGVNTERTFVWIVIPSLAPNQSVIIDLVMDNASAGSPPTLTMTSSPQRPALDISGSGYATNTSSNTTSVTITGAGWETDQWQGGTVITGTGGTGNLQMRRVASNTATVLTVARAWSVLATGTDLTVLKSGFMGDGGTASAGAATSLTDAAQSWRTNEWIGATVEITSGTGSGQTRTVISNTATALTVATWGTNPDATSVYSVYRLNGIFMWDTRPVPKTTNHPGLWLTNKTTAPPTQVSLDAPGSWYRFTYQRSDDEYSQPRYASFEVGAGDYDHMPTMYIQRARKGRVGDQREVGLADSVGVFSPFPINGAYFGYTFRNAKQAGSGSPGEGMCEARFQFQESGGNSWASFLSDVAVYSTSTAIAPAWYDLSASSPNRIAMSLIPNGSDEIPENDNNTALLQSSGNHVSLSIDSRNLSSSINWWTFVTSPDTCSDPYLAILTGGAAATRPYDRIVIGAPGHRLFLKHSGASYDEQIKIDCETHTISLVNNAGTFIRRIPYGAQIQQVIADADGVQRELTNARWLPIRPSTIDSANIYFADLSGAGWLLSVRISATGKLGYLT
jgi:hypothetical protein